jgi:hypothetical protein
MYVVRRHDDEVRSVMRGVHAARRPRNTTPQLAPVDDSHLLSIPTATHSDSAGSQFQNLLKYTSLLIK